MSDSPLPAVATPIRRIRPQSRTPDVRLTIANLQRLPPQESQPRLARWPARPRRVHQIDSNPTDGSASRKHDVTGREPLLHRQIAQLLDAGRTAVACEYPAVPQSAMDVGRDEAAEFAACDDNADDMDERLPATDPFDRGDAPHGRHLHGLDLNSIRRAAAVATDETDEFSVLEKAASARLDVVRQALSLFARSFSQYAPFLSFVVREIGVFSRATREAHARRAADVVEKGKFYTAELQRFTDERKDLQEALDATRARLHEFESQKHAKDSDDRQARLEHVALQRECAEKSRRLADAEELNAIHSRKLFAAEKEIEDLKATLKSSTSKVVALHKQLAVRQGICDKLNASLEAAYNEKTALQRQLVQLPSAAGDPRVRRGSRVRPRDVDLTPALRACYDVQVEHVLAQMNAAVTAVSGFSKTSLTPRPSGVTVGETSRRFSEMELKLRVRTEELAEARAALKNLHEQLCPVMHTRAVLPGSIARLGDHHAPAHVEYFQLSGQGWFPALGDGPEVPPHLQAFGRAKNLRISRTLLLEYVADFLTSLTIDYGREALLHGVNASRALAEWASGRFGQEQAADVGYSMQHALGMFAFEARCSFMLELLSGVTSTAVHVAVEDIVDNLKSALSRAVSSTDDMKLPKRTTLAVLERTFAAMDDNDIARIMSALTADQRGDGVNVAAIFAPGRSESALLATIREVLHRDRLSLIGELQAALTADSSTAAGLVSPHALVSAILRVDPKRPAEQVEAALLLVFGETVRSTIQVSDPETPLSDRYATAGESVSLVDAVQRLRSLPYARWTKRIIAQAYHDRELAERLQAGAAERAATVTSHSM